MAAITAEIQTQSVLVVATYYLRGLINSIMVCFHCVSSAEMWTPESFNSAPAVDLGSLCSLLPLYKYTFVLYLSFHLPFSVIYTDIIKGSLTAKYYFTVQRLLSDIKTKSVWL